MFVSSLLKFGDVVLDPNSQRLLVAIDANKGFNKRTKFIFFIELSDDLNPLGFSPKPRVRNEVLDYVFKTNIADSIVKYLEVAKIHYECEMIRDYRFNIRKQVA